MEKVLRVAFFPDSYLEINGAAMTCRRLVGYARDNGYPFLCVHAGPKSETTTDGSVTHLSLKRSPFSIKLDEDLAYDPFFQRHVNRVMRALMEFRPDVIHITGLNDISIVGVYLGWKLQLPILGSWHTNVHEFAASRISKMLRFLPKTTSRKITNLAEKKILDGSILFYKIPKVILSPNQELVDLLGKGTKRVSRIMSRGVDTVKFSPEKRTVNDSIIRFGFVGRLRAEKSVRQLAVLEDELIKAGKQNFEFLIVGEGDEREYLSKHMKNAVLTGFLDGEKLSEAYANMDIFIFPSETDAFGNVTQEANASGVPAIVTDQGGPKFIVIPEKTGFVAKNLAEFVKYTIMLMEQPARLAEMKKLAREHSMSRSWDAVFESVYDGYKTAFELQHGQVKD